MISLETVFKAFVASHPNATPAEIGEFVRGVKASLGVLVEGGAPEEACEAPAVEEAVAAPDVMKPVSKRVWKVKGEELGNCIQKDFIVCPICGEQCKTLTSKHLASHGYTREAFYKATGWDPSTPLMSKDHAKKMRINVAKAQEARRAKMGLGEQQPAAE